MAFLKINQLRKSYGSSVMAVKDFTINIDEGEFIVIVGPSGCGKSTTLRMIAGLESPDSGEIVLDGEVINNTPVQKRDMAMVFQNYALYETMTAFENIAFPLRMRKFSKTEINSAVEKISDSLGISNLLDRYPSELSGGEKQRVAMGRALIRSPKLFLMDEPLSNLDARLRIQLREEISLIQRTLGTTTIYVTHDQTEAMTLANRIVVMKDGEIMQIGTPEEIYNEPANPFVAEFFEAHPMNFFESEGKLFGVRPEHIQIAEIQEDDCWIPAEVMRIELLGAERMYYLRANNRDFRVTVPSDRPVMNKKVWVYINENSIYTYKKF